MAGGTTIDGAQNRPLLIAVANTWRDAVAGGADTVPDPTPSGAMLTTINPTTGVHGGPGVTLHAIGSGYVKGFHQIDFQGPKPTTWVSATELTALVTGANAGTVQVRVTGAEGSRPYTLT